MLDHPKRKWDSSSRKGKIGIQNPGRKRGLSTVEMKNAEAKGVSIGISHLVMMENAGNQLAQSALHLIPWIQGYRHKKKYNISVIGGTGNNGGDAFVAARHLAYYGNLFRISTFLIGDEKRISTEEALSNWRILKQISKTSCTVIDSLSKLGEFRRALRRSDLILAGIFGTSFRGKPRELQMEIIYAVNAQKSRPVLSVDVPSGMDADSGNSEFAIRSSATVTMHAPKEGMFANRRATLCCGRIIVANIGLPF